MKQLLNTIEQDENSNKYYYKKMLSDLEFESRYNLLKRTLKNKWRSASLKYLERVNHMKEKTEETFNTKMSKLKQNLNNKDKDIKQRIEQNKRNKEEERKHSHDLFIKKEKRARDTYNRKLAMDEEERTDNEKKLIDRSKYIILFIIIYFYFLVNIFIKRNEQVQMKKHEREMNKIKEQEIRHNKNIILEKEKFEKKENDNKDKIMKKYVTFYWNRKGREENKKNKFVHFNEKYEEKFNRLEELEKAEEKKKKNLMKKLLTIETNQKEYIEKEKQKYENIKEKRYQYFIMCRNNKQNINKYFTEETKGIISYQHFVLSRQKQSEEKNKLKKENVMEKTIYNQLKFEKNLKPFYKTLDRIKSESIIKKSKEQRKKIFRDLKRAEAEARKREEEERLLNQQVG